jgi:chromosomal replication initiation ATPase DnaA
MSPHATKASQNQSMPRKRTILDKEHQIPKKQRSARPEHSTRLADIEMALNQPPSTRPPFASIKNSSQPAQRMVNAIPARRQFAMTPQHTHALEAVMLGKSVFIHGGPGQYYHFILLREIDGCIGTGKTHLLQIVIEQLRAKYQETPESLVVSAGNGTVCF